MANGVEKYANVYRTSNYNMFKRLDGNRSLTGKRAKQIIKSIKSVGYVCSPLIVNEKKEVVDGQGRLEALKLLGLPVDYIIVPGIGYDECVSMNTVQSNWKLTDFVESYAEQGNESYQYLHQLIKCYGKVTNARVIGGIAEGSTMQVGQETIISGRLKCDKEHYEEAVKILDYIAELKQVLRPNGRFEAWATALNFCFRHPDINNKALKEKIFAMRAELCPISRTEQALEILENIWNYRNRKKVYLTADFKRANDEAKTNR